MSAEPLLHQSNKERTAMRRTGLVAAIGYIATIFLANWLIQHVGIVDFGFLGLAAPAGVFAAGLALGLRDIVQDTLGRWPVVAAIVIGAGLSYLVSPAFALASGVAFLLSEFTDMTVYTPLRERSWYSAVALSNTVGAVVDSALFLWIAFGSLAFFPGQVVGKVLMVAPVLAWGALGGRRALLARHTQTELAR